MVSSNESLLASDILEFVLKYRVAIAVPLIIVLFSAITGRKQRQPPGTYRLPRLPGKQISQAPYALRDTDYPLLGIPWIGRVWDIPTAVTETSWHFSQFFKKYGPIYEWQAMGDIHIWIGKDSIARDLLVKRGKIYGDRHELPAAVGIKGGSEILPLMGIGENVGGYECQDAMSISANEKGRPVLETS